MAEDSRLLINIPEAAARLAIGRSTLYELIETGEIPVVKIGNAVRIQPSVLKEWVERQIQLQMPGGA